MAVHLKFPTLIKLRGDNLKEFRYQIVAQLKRISGEKNIFLFTELIDQFKNEFINDSYYYVDSLNDVVRNLIYKDKPDLVPYYKHFLFLCQIGDAYTLELATKYLQCFTKDMKVYELIQKEIQNLEKRLTRCESEMEDVKLYPILEINDEWLD